MFAMVLITFLIGLYTFVVRVQSVRSRKLNYRAFLLMNAENYPENVQKTTRSFNNQFEIPVLFYAVCLAYLATGTLSELALPLAWLFIALRLVHTAIHLTYNHLVHRFSVFWLSAFVVLAMWVDLVVKIS